MSFAPLTTVAKIESHFRGQKFNSTSSITDTEVESFIDEGTNIIYGALRERYEIPTTGISNTEDLKQLDSLCQKYVIPIIKVALGANRSSNKSDGKIALLEADHREFREFLKMYKEGDLLLNYTSNQNSEFLIQSNSYNQENNISTVGKMGKDQW